MSVHVDAQSADDGRINGNAQPDRLAAHLRELFDQRVFLTLVERRCAHHVSLGDAHRFAAAGMVMGGAVRERTHRAPLYQYPDKIQQIDMHPIPKGTIRDVQPLRLCKGVRPQQADKLGIFPESVSQHIYLLADDVHQLLVSCQFKETFAIFTSQFRHAFSPAFWINSSTSLA